MITQEKVDAGIISRLYGLQHEDKYNVARSTIIHKSKSISASLVDQVKLPFP
jgi:hypothetical protein